LAIFQDSIRCLSLLVLFAFLGFCSIGCSFGSGRVQQPKYNSNSGAEAVRLYDTNGDGSISGDELNRVPALKASFAQVDSDNDKRLTAQEIEDRVTQWQNSKVAEMPVRCKVTINGFPLKDAEVKFIPEGFLGTDLPSAEGVTTEDGVAVISMPKEKLSDSRYPAVACGWYKITVTSAVSKIPSRYNTDTTFGCEVAMNAGWLAAGEVLLDIRIP